MSAILPETFAPLDFTVPSDLEAHDPPEAWGRAREDVRMLVAYRRDGRLLHARFSELPSYLKPGDLLVINTSGTLAASVPVERADGTRLDLHLSTPVHDNIWVVELRTPIDAGGRPFRGVSAGETLRLPEGSAQIMAAYASPRLWTAALHLGSPLGSYLQRYGHPIRYGTAGREWPISYYQNVYALEPGSVEMPSAGRPFTAEMMTGLITRGIDVVPITLHAGVSSLEDHEPPMAELYRVPEQTAKHITGTREAGGRVIAVGTTVIRALETVADAGGAVHAGRGWTELIISPDHRVRTADGLLTGWHEPCASHLMMLEAVAGRNLLERSYAAALERRYRWHEFGDVHLILP